MGAPAPIGFADVIERVKPAVVGVRVKVADTAPADDAQRRPSDAPAPFDPGIMLPGTSRHLFVLQNLVAIRA